MVPLTGTTDAGHMRADLDILDFCLGPESGDSRWGWPGQKGRAGSGAHPAGPDSTGRRGGEGVRSYFVPRQSSAQLSAINADCGEVYFQGMFVTDWSLEAPRKGYSKITAAVPDAS
jgi:hypothetical protein